MKQTTDIRHQISATTAPGDLGATIAPSTPPLRAYRVLWPLFTLLLLEALGFGLVAATRALPATIFSVLMAGCVLLAGLIPALLRPSPASNLFGCFTVLLASVLWLVPPASFEQPRSPFLPDSAVPLHLMTLRLVNGAFLAPLTLHITARFPRPNALSNQMIAYCYAVIAALLLMTLLSPPGALPLGALVILPIALCAMFGTALWQLLRASRDTEATHGRAARQARLLLLSSLLAITPMMLRPLARLVDITIPYDIALAGTIILPLGVAYTIMQHDLFGIDAALRRTLAYMSLSFAVLVVYLGLTVSLTMVLGQVDAPERGPAVLAGLLIAAIAFTPLLRRARVWINHAFYPEHFVFRHEISAARATLGQVVRRDAVITLLNDTLPRRLGAIWARLTLYDADAASLQPDRVGAWSAPLVVSGKVMGHYALGPRHTGLPYAPDEQEQLQALTQQAALALAYAEVFDALTLLNEELEERVATRTEHLLAQQRALVALEERQRIARDLHDSVKQTLFSLGLGLRAIRGLMSAQPDAALAALREEEALAVQAQEEMGRLLAQLRAPSPDTTNLSEALIQHCALLRRQHNLNVLLDIPPALIMPEPLAGELLHIAREALHNVVKHSGIAEARLSINDDGEQVLMTISDNGCGFDPPLQASADPARMGLRGMRERAEMLGGTLVVQSAPGQGARVSVQIRRQP